MTALIARLGGPLAFLCAGTLTTAILSKGNLSAAEPDTDKVTVVAEEKHGTAFLRKSALGSMMEIKLGQLAKEKGSAVEVRDFGNRMVQDHTRSLADIRALASSKNITLPTEDSNEAKKVHDHLSALTGEKFDKAYIRHMIEDHQKDIADAKGAAENNKDKDVRALAEKLRALYQEHLDHAKKVKQSLKD